MVVDLVTYRVKRGKEREFERHHEDWARLMRRSRGFVARVLMRNAEDPAEYRAEVRWVSKEYRDRFNALDDGDAKALLKASAGILEGPPTHSLLEPV